MAPRISPFGYHRHVFQVRIPSLALTGAASDVVTSWTPGFAFEVEKIEYVITVAHTSAGAATRAFTLKRGSTAVAVITPTHATAVTAGGVGVVIAQTSLDKTVAKFKATDTLTLAVDTGTVFTAGQADLYVTVRELAQTRE